MKRIVYITSLFPCWSETFILSEIIEINKKGEFEISILSLKSPREKLVHEKAKDFLGSTIYPSGRITQITRNIVFLFKYPVFYFTFILEVFLSKCSFLTKIKQMACVFITVDLLANIDWAEVRHIHSHWATFPTLSANFIGSLFKVPYSFTAHAHDIYLEKPLLEKKIMDAESVVTISDFNKRYLTDFCSKDCENKIHVIRCGVNLEDFNFVERSFATTGRGKTILSIGRLCPIKGFEYLVMCMGILVTKLFPKEDIECILVGDGEDKGEITALIKKFGLEQYFDMPGALSQKKIKELLRECDVFVLPSVVAKDGNRDGIPVVLMEAMASGIPVVTTNVSGLPEIAIDRETALVVPQRDPQLLAEAVQNILLNGFLAESLRLKARKLVEQKYNIMNNALKVIELFK